MGFTSISEMQFPEIEMPMVDTSFANEDWDDLAEGLDVELLKEFFGSSVVEEIAKNASAEDSPSEAFSSTQPPSTAFPSPSAPSSSPSAPSSSSPTPSPSSTTPSTRDGRKRKATQDRICTNCQTPESSMWRRDPVGNSLCNACRQHFYKFKVHRPAAMFGRAIKKRCRKVKQDEAPTTSWIPPFPIGQPNYGMMHVQQQPQQFMPPHPYYHHPVPAPQFYQPPPQVGYWQSNSSYQMMPHFQQSQW